jgi:LmbE family N-acetylglucosaminyl deacetylase
MLLKRFSMRTRAIGAAILLFAVSCRSSQPAATASCDNDALTAYPALLVLAPHPDDETLGAGGLIQRVRTLGGNVQIVYLTDGDGFPEGVQVADHVETPSASDYRGYGRERRSEARAALRVLGVPADAHTFLSFPDSGLCQLMRTYWSERRRAYKSPYTRLDRPPKSEILVPDTEYRG